MHCPSCGTEAPAGQEILPRLWTESGALCAITRGAGCRMRKMRMWREPGGDCASWRELIKIAGWTAGSALGILFAFLGVLTMIKSHIGGGIVLLLFGIGIHCDNVGHELSVLFEQKGLRRSTSQPALPSAETTNKLLSEDQPQIAMSVTEQTTAQLGEKIESRR